MADEGVEGVAAVTSKRSASPEDDAAAASKKPKRSASDEEAGAQTSEQTKLVDGAAASSSASGRDKFFLDSLPCASRYIRSLMHRDTLTFVKVTPHTNFVLTASLDGFVKFWKKQETGVEFVKQYRAHLAPVTGLCVSADGALAASISSDGSCKVFDVVNFDLINMIKVNYTPRTCSWVHRRGRADSILAVSEEGSPTIRLYDGRGDGSPRATIESLHRAPCHLLAYNEPFDCVVSADVGGMVEYWSPTEPYEAPKGKGLWEYKSRTDLFDFKKAKSTPTSLDFSPDSSRFVTVSTADRQIRIFDFASGKLLRKYDESLQAAHDMHSGNVNESEPSELGGALRQHQVQLDDMEFGRRLALERDLDASAQDAVGNAVRAASGACSANVVFDESGTFILYGSMLGIKIINTKINEVALILGKDETTRFLNVSLFQGVANRKKAKSIALAASENPLLAAQKEEHDPTLFCTAFKRARFYMFSRQEPDNDPRSKSGAERDIFNEKPTREEQTIASLNPLNSRTGPGRSNVSQTAVLHTTMGDIHLRLFPEQVHKTVENFVGLARKGYYDGVLFHRVIKKFMLQTGDPLGDGTGGESLWGREFEDEFVRELRHDRPYVLSMANAGPNTNGSQFFITTVPAPWLDDKHTIFGRASAGFDVIHAIEAARTDRNTDKPKDDISGSLSSSIVPGPLPKLTSPCPPEIMNVTIG